MVFIVSSSVYSRKSTLQEENRMLLSNSLIISPASNAEGTAFSSRKMVGYINRKLSSFSSVSPVKYCDSLSMKATTGFCHLTSNY
jgi:hypothetical protein